MHMSMIMMADAGSRVTSIFSFREVGKCNNVLIFPLCRICITCLVTLAKLVFPVYRINILQHLTLVVSNSALIHFIAHVIQWNE